jgi:hypothetical protein
MILLIAALVWSVSYNLWWNYRPKNPRVFDFQGHHLTLRNSLKSSVYQDDASDKTSCISQTERLRQQREMQYVLAAVALSKELTEQKRSMRIVQ